MDHQEPEIDPAIAHLDIPFCGWHPKCDRLALWRIRFHFVNHCQDPCCEHHAALRDEDGNQRVDLCGGCFETLRQEVAAHVWKLNQAAKGRAICLQCGHPVVTVNDVIREREKL